MKIFNLVLLTMIVGNSMGQLDYPKTKKIKHKDVYFGTSVADPYRWLEDDRSTQTTNWVKEQSAFTADFLAKIPFRDSIKQQMLSKWNYEKISAPFFEGGQRYFYKNDGVQAQSILYKEHDNGTVEVFLDPNKFASDGTTSLSMIKFSHSGKMAAYAISEGGSDWNKIIIINTDTKEQLDETLVDVKFSGIEWRGDEGFYYCSYDKPKGSELSAKTDAHKIYFHQIGTKQKEDHLIVGGNEFKRRYLSAKIDETGTYLVVSAANTTYGNELYVKNIKANGDLIPIQTGYDVSTNVVKIINKTAYAITDKNAPNRKLIAIDLDNPMVIKEIIPESEFALNCYTGAGFIFAQYLKDAIAVVHQYDFEGKFIREVKLPGLGTISGFGGKTKDKDLYYSFTNYITPGSIYQFNPQSGESSMYFQPKIDFDPADYVTEQVFYTSKDGTKIPMTISYKKGLELNGKNPTILYSYGGFNISLTPSFSVVNAIWMDNGGVYAVPNIRGGGEYGKKWHDAGTKLDKKNVFEDFIAAGEYLKEKGYTSTEFLAISGRSNGGLLVGATMTMKPDFCKVAFPGVGVLDMLRYHTFTAGAGWAYDYGTAEQSEEMFKYLKSYSPVHNVKKGIKYPATMIITSDHDDRVVPAHSFKFAAELQAKSKGENPMLIRIEMNAGHGAGRSTEQIVNENTDLICFALYIMGLY